MLNESEALRIEEPICDEEELNGRETPRPKGVVQEADAQRPGRAKPRASVEPNMRATLKVETGAGRGDIGAPRCGALRPGDGISGRWAGQAELDTDRPDPGCAVSKDSLASADTNAGELTV